MLTPQICKNEFRKTFIRSERIQTQRPLTMRFHVWKQSAHDSQDQWQTVVAAAAGVGAGVTQIGLCFLSGVVGDSQGYVG